MFERFFRKEIVPEEIRKDFTFLNSNPTLAYLDNACMSLRPDIVPTTLTRYYHEFPGCAGRSNHHTANKVQEEITQAREKVAKFFGAKSLNQVIFTKNCTEAINMVANSFKFQNGDVVLTTDKEHNSNLVPWLKLQNKWHIKHDYIPSAPKNEFSTDNLIKKLNEHKGKVKLVSVVFTSNLEGVTNPVKDIIRLAHKHKAKVLLDCAQASLHHQINIKKLDADFITVSAHKMLGPSGVGALIGKEEELNKLDQFLVGGETVVDSFLTPKTPSSPEQPLIHYVADKLPHKFEAGLQNYPGIMAFGAAVDYLDKLGPENVQDHLIKLNKIVTEGLKTIPQVKLLGPVDPKKRCGIFSFTIENKSTHEVALLLDNTYNIAVRSGQHCVHSWFNQDKNKNSPFVDGTIRASFGPYNTEAEAQKFVQAIKEISEL